MFEMEFAAEQIDNPRLCDRFVWVHDVRIPEKGMAMALNRDRPDVVDLVTEAVAVNAPVFEELKRRYKISGKCEQPPDTSLILGIKAVSGVFTVLLIGLCMGVGVLAAELIYLCVKT